MWGQAWGTMIWGTAPPVPAMGTLSLVLLGGLLALVARHAIRRGASARGTALLAAVATVGVAWSALAQSGGMLPFTFSNGTVADATQVNANFTFLGNAVNALETQGLPRTRYLAIPALAFTPSTVGQTGYELDNRVILRKVPGAAGSVLLLAPVYLPDGAVITQLTAYVQDANTTAGENIQVSLLLSPPGSFSPSATTIATLNSDSIQPTVNIGTLSSPAASVPVTPFNGSLFLQVILNGTSGDPRLNEILIQYQY
jgi:hypothetical protein